MKKMFFAVVAMLFVSALQGAAKSCDVNVMQWNLHIAIDMNGRYNLKKQADVILTHDPDVVVLNEIDKNCARTGYIDMTRELATMTGMCFSQFGAARVLPPEGLYGNAVLSRYAMELVGSWHIPASLDEPRGMTLVKIKAPNPFLIAFTHLCWRQTPEENIQRIKAAESIDILVRRNNPGKLPVIVIGDYNCYPDSDPVKKMTELGWSIGKVLPTYPSKAPKSAIDHIFTRTDDKRIEILDRIGIDEKIASDHIPVINKLRIYRNR
ncbi:MAG: endonuclease/exonuclease/phosphatase family protein [Lentisphaeria bacterium]|nr:endonuclease/exonuclease/phosphatase family protein [Lentisphaeria bacterium]